MNSLMEESINHIEYVKTKLYDNIIPILEKDIAYVKSSDPLERAWMIETKIHTIYTPQIDKIVNLVQDLFSKENILFRLFSTDKVLHDLNSLVLTWKLNDGSLVLMNCLFPSLNMTDANFGYMCANVDLENTIIKGSNKMLHDWDKLPEWFVNSLKRNS